MLALSLNPPTAANGVKEFRCPERLRILRVKPSPGISVEFSRPQVRQADISQPEEISSKVNEV